MTSLNFGAKRNFMKRQQKCTKFDKKNQHKLMRKEYETIGLKMKDGVK